MFSLSEKTAISVQQGASFTLAALETVDGGLDV